MTAGTPDPRMVIAQYLLDNASYARQRAMRRDGAHARAVTPAERLEALSRHVLSLPEGDPRVDTLFRLTVLDGDSVISPGPRLSSALADIRHYSPAIFDVFLEYLVHAAIDDSIQDSRPPVPLLIDDPALAEARGGAL